MTRPQTHILELFRTLPANEQRELATLLYEMTREGSLYERLTASERAQLEAGISEADIGNVVSAETAMVRLAQRFDFRRS